MKTFKQYFEESTEGIGNLYHNTNIVSLFNILRDDALRLTYSSAIESEEMKFKNSPFFISTSRVKFGKHAGGDNFKSEFFSSVMINIDISKLKKYGIKYMDWDYWGDSFKKVPNFREEQEVRIFHSEPKLEPLGKYVDSIHVFLSERESKYYLEKIAEMKSNVDVPIYFYENPTAYKMQQTKFAIEDINEFLNSIPDVSPEDREYHDLRATNNRFRDDGNLLIRTLLSIYNGTYDHTTANQGRSSYSTPKNIFDKLYAWDGLQTILNDFHGAMRNHPEEFKTWHREMLKSGAGNTKEFVKIIQDKAHDLYTPYGTKKNENI